MSHSKFALTALAVAALTMFPMSTDFGGIGATAVHAKGGNGGGNGEGKGSSSKSDKGSGKSGATRSGKSGEKKVSRTGSGSAKSQKAVKSTKTSKAKPIKAAERPKARDLGKMNGALHANINAVLAHIRNGNLNGPVGLLAGLAIADAEAAAAKAAAAELQASAAAQDALTAELASLGYASVPDYLAAVADGQVTPEEDAAVTTLIDAAGGLNDEGTDLATARPTEDQIATALQAAIDSGAAIADAEQDILDAWNKDGDPDALLSALRDRLKGKEDAIADAIASAAEADETAASTDIADDGATTVSN